MIKSIFLILFPLLSWGQTPPCEEVNLLTPGIPGLSEFYPQDQGEYGTCYAHVASDLINHRLRQRQFPIDTLGGGVDPFILAALGRKSRREDPNDFNGGGFAQDLIRSFSDSNLLCQEPFTLYDYLDSRSLIDHSESASIVSEFLFSNSSLGHSFTFLIEIIQQELMQYLAQGNTTSQFIETISRDQASSSSHYTPRDPDFATLYNNLNFRPFLIGFTLHLAQNQDDENANEGECPSLQIPNGEVSALTDDVSEILLRLYQESCENFYQGLPIEDPVNQNLLLPQETLTSISRHIHETVLSNLNQQNPVGLDVCANFLNQPLSQMRDDFNFDSLGARREQLCNGEDSFHSVSINGMRTHGNQCQYLIRNSWGHDFFSANATECYCHRVINGVLTGFNCGPDDVNNPHEQETIITACWINKDLIDRSADSIFYIP